MQIKTDMWLCSNSNQWKESLYLFFTQHKCSWYIKFTSPYEPRIHGPLVFCALSTLYGIHSTVAENLQSTRFPDITETFFVIVWSTKQTAYETNTNFLWASTGRGICWRPTLLGPEWFYLFTFLPQFFRVTISNVNINGIMKIIFFYSFNNF